MTEQEQPLPNDLDAEQATLGAMLVSEEAHLIALSIVEPADFYREAHRFICTAMKQVADCHEPVDLITVSAVLRGAGQLEEVGGGAYLTALMNEVPTAKHVAKYANTVREHSLRRQAMTWAAEVQAKAADATGDFSAFLADTVTGALKHADQSKRLSAAPIGEHLQRHGPTLRAAIEAPFAVTPARFGIADLDAATGGMGGLYLITAMAEEKAGKSTFGVHAAMSTAQRFLLQEPESERERVLVFFIEEGPYSWLRLASGWLAGINTRTLLTGRCPADDKKETLRRIAEAQNILTDYPVLLGDAAETTDAIVTAIRVEAQRYKLGLVVVDYLQRLSTNEQYLSMMDAARALQKASESIQAPLLLLSQMSYNDLTGKPLPYGGRGASIDASLVLDIRRGRGEFDEKLDTGEIVCIHARSIEEFAPVEYRVQWKEGGHYYSIDKLRDNPHGQRVGDDKPTHQNWG